MRTRVPALLAILLLPLFCYGQSTLTFPRVMRSQDLGTTGFAIINPSSSIASVTFTLYGADGSVQTASPQMIGIRGQLAKLASEIFPGATAGGWVQVTSGITGLQGFWFGGDLVTFGDGAEAATSSNELVLPMVSTQSEIHIVNTGTTSATVLMDVQDADGFKLDDPFPQLLAPKGSFNLDLASMFPRVSNPASPTHMHITCNCPDGGASFAATVIARNLAGVAPSWSVLNGVPANSPTTTIYFPNLVDGPQTNANWRSLIGVTNLSQTLPNDITLTFFPASGTPRTILQTLAPNGGLRVPARDLFALTDGFQSGWVRVTSSLGLPLTGYIAYADTIAGGVAVVPPQPTADTTLLFAHIADLPPWFTGIALLNTNSVAANVRIYALTPAGALIGSTTTSLPPSTNTARLLRDLIPQTQTRTTDGGYVFVQSDVPILGIELFFSRNLQVLANVAGSRLAPGITFVPPGQ